ncbi:MAG: hypothetical protein AAB932_02610 [Patescibacteria group bacterium]
MTYQELLKERKAWYKNIKRLFCPILDEHVIFNSKGFYHLRYKSGGHERSKKEQMYKLGLLPLVIPVIKNASKIHQYKKEQYSKPLGKYYEIWELSEAVGQQNTMVSVVLRRIGDGNITFLSVWKKKDTIIKKLSK